jgi:four helix bundle protein
MKQHNYEKLKIWEDRMDLAEKIFIMTKKLPEDEKFGLTSQMRRAGYSIPSNIAEGAGRNTDKSFNSFLNISQGSLGELHTQTLLCERVGYLVKEDTEVLISEIKKIKNGIHKFQEVLEK